MLHSDSIVLRAAEAADERFLYDVYVGTRADVAALDWGTDEQAAFLSMQHRAQNTYYRAHFADARFDVIELEGVAVGRLYVYRDQSEIRLLDIALLPQHVGKGVGTILLRALQAEADSTGKVLVLHVEQYNPARQLYLRLGFVPVDQYGVHVRMQWPAPTSVEADQRPAKSPSVENSLVALADLVRPDRDKEDIQRPARRIVQGVDPL